MIPSAAAPKRSLCKAIRFLSLQTICRIGSNPISFRITDADSDDILTTEV